MLVQPGVGLIVWMTVAFLVVWFLLGKFAWKPILKSLKERESSIEDSLNQAKKAKEEVAALKSDNEKLLQEARNERDAMLKEARETKERIVAEAKAAATEEGNAIVAKARESIQNEKNAAITELKNHVATLSIEIAEKILKAELDNEEKQKQLVSTLLEDVKLN